MDSVQMVRCFLSRDPKENGSVRYVPLEIYEMWRFLMQKVHLLTVQEPVVSTWVATGDDYGKSDPDNVETVIEIKFNYRDKNNVGKPVVRYFPEVNFDQIYGYFRQHFPEESKMEGVSRRKGLFMTDRAVPYKLGK